MLIELPCGLLMNNTVYDHIMVHELKGKQQNYLVNSDLTSDNFGHIPKILEDLVSDLQTKEGLPANIPVKEAIWQLPTEDLEVILIKIREATFGPNFAMPTVCLHCAKQQLKKIALDQLEIKQLPDKRIRSKTIELPKSKKKVEVKLLYLKDLFELFKSLKDKKAELFTATTFLSVQSIDGKSPVTSADLEEIPLTDIHVIEQTYMDMRGSIDLMITHECDECGREFENPLGVMDPLFFARSQTPST